MDITPEKQNIDSLFSNTNFLIDFYQREYKWRKDEVLRLLEDIFYKFNHDYVESLEPTTENVTRRYGWYYLNTYITNKSGGQTYVVDGQQRLTTLSLILIKLYHLSEKFNNETQKDWLKAKIYGPTASGPKYWMGDGKRQAAMNELFRPSSDPKIVELESVTETNMSENYDTVSNYLDRALGDPHRLSTFVIYFLKRVVIVNLDVETTDVPMVFEVINDRGMRLKPYEILKGKLLGQIDKDEVEEFVKLWEDQIRELETSEDGKLVDDCFRTFLKARFADNRDQSKKYDGEYHKMVFEDPVNSVLKLKNSASSVKNFLRSEFSYYVTLYNKILNLGTNTKPGFEAIYYNAYLTEMSSQNILALSACSLKDPNENEKIAAVAKELDRLYVLLQLNRAYDSNGFTDAIYILAKELRTAPSVSDFRKIFDKVLLSEIAKARNIEAITPFDYNAFKDVGYQDLNKNFLRYFYARIELFLCSGLGQQLQESLSNLVRNTGPVNGYHIEHIFGRNHENLALFEGREEVFDKERNRLGALLLLKGRDNESSGNEVYVNKLRTYDGTLIWNQTLRDDFYKSNLAVRDFKDSSKLALGPVREFNRNALEARSQLLFEMVQRIWS
ncbi:MAG: DUF262 domain-containing protein [Candidatus Kapaibacterium sp.]